MENTRIGLGKKIKIKKKKPFLSKHRKKQKKNGLVHIKQGQIFVL